MGQNPLLEQVRNGNLLNTFLLSAIVNNQSPSARKSFDVISSFGFKETRGIICGIVDDYSSYACAELLIIETLCFFIG